MNSLPKEAKQFAKVATSEEIAALEKATLLLLDAAKSKKSPREVLLEIQNTVVAELQKGCGSTKGGSSKEKLPKISENESENESESESDNAAEDDKIKELKGQARRLTALLRTSTRRNTLGRKLHWGERKWEQCKFIGKKHLMPFLQGQLLLVRAVLNALRGGQIDQLDIVLYLPFLMMLIHSIYNEIHDPKFKYVGKLFEHEANENVSVRENVIHQRNIMRQRIIESKARERLLKQNFSRSVRETARGLASKISKKGRGGTRKVKQ